MIKRSLVTTLLVCLTLACADRDVLSAEDETTGPEPDPGQPFSGCMDKGDCFDEWCLHPAGEPGFCTYACNTVANCSSAAGGTATLTCLPVDNDKVCALDCGGGKSCPWDMRCETIEANGEATAEISRAQVWQWRRHGAALDDGRVVDAELIRRIVADEMQTIRAEVGDSRFTGGRFELARDLFLELALADELADFLTLGAYAHRQ